VRQLLPLSSGFAAVSNGLDVMAITNRRGDLRRAYGGLGEGLIEPRRHISGDPIPARLPDEKMRVSLVEAKRGSVLSGDPSLDPRRDRDVVSASHNQHRAGDPLRIDRDTAERDLTADAAAGWRPERHE
jgi:hypothetical protein